MLTLVGLVTGDGAWESNKEYRYKLVAGTLKSLPQSKNEFVGVFSRAYLTIRPQSDDLLIGQITQAEYGKVNQKLYGEWISNLEDRKLENWPLDKPFKIHLENGVIRSLSVDDSMTNYEINQLKVIVSQFQVDTNAQNKIDFSDNQLPGTDTTNAFYKTMEPIVTGNCETDYEISLIPDYLLRSNPEWIPLPELSGTGQIIEIVKTRSYSNCHETSDYLLDIAGRNDFKTNGYRKNDLHLNENRRIVISGDLKAYTIQSSVTFNTVINGRDNNSPPLTDYINVTLQSVEERNTPTEFRFENVINLKNVGNLVYTYDSDANTAPTKVKSQPQLCKYNFEFCLLISNNDCALCSVPHLIKIKLLTELF